MQMGVASAVTTWSMPERWVSGVRLRHKLDKHFPTESQQVSKQGRYIALWIADQERDQRSVDASAKNGWALTEHRDKCAGLTFSDIVGVRSTT